MVSDCNRLVSASPSKQIGYSVSSIFAIFCQQIPQIIHTGPPNDHDTGLLHTLPKSKLYFRVLLALVQHPQQAVVTTDAWFNVSNYFRALQSECKHPHSALQLISAGIASGGVHSFKRFQKKTRITKQIIMDRYRVKGLLELRACPVAKTGYNCLTLN